ncbi:MAG TPA: diguanylate cyclase [Chloroflexia bacterium]|jgi:diguanylate cyclase (GGDEF)-like protein|nr:diguanylate cyclase [Chloroflexia bacterium]
MAVGVANIDPLTGALTRASLAVRLSREAEAAGQAGGSFSLLMLDLDYFKSINDAFGHTRGDTVLVEFARRVRVSIRDTDLLFRYGGDEFLVLLPGTSGREAAGLARRLLEDLRSHHFEGDPPLFLSASIGAASYPTEAPDASALVELADQRAYLAKRAGRDSVHAGDETSTGGTPASPLGSVSRLIERDAALQTFGDFLDALPGAGRGAFSVLGQAGAGLSRFLQETATLGRLRGYMVMHLQGDSALKQAELGALHRAGHAWLPPSVYDPVEVALIIDAQVRTGGHAGLMFAVDDVAALDDATLETLRAGMASSPGYPVCIVSTGHGQPEKLQGVDVPLLASVELRPLSRSGLGVWVRSLLRWEPPARFISWLHRETGGLPALVERALYHLLEKAVLFQNGGNWTLAADYTAVELERGQGRETKPRPDSLPSLPYSFVGRGREMAKLRDLVSLERLVTVTGPGGVGKTHLALHAASEMLDGFQDGVFFVPLATILDPELVAPGIAQVLGVKAPGGGSPVEALVDYLRDKKLLLLLDNLEQVSSAAPILGRLVHACPGLRVLVTSREPLHLRGEHVFPLAPLAVPQLNDRRPASIESYPAVTLFVQRAQAANPGFELTPDNAETVAAICSRLDGLPLAIELVAARTRHMSPKAILARLGTRLDPSALRLLTGGPRDLPARHQTLRDAIAWSYDLLPREEQLLFACLGAFAGGFTLAAVEAICASEGGPLPGAPMLDLVTSLLDKSLLRATHDACSEDEPRYTLLEMLREFAGERLAATGDREKVSRLHALYFMRLADETEAKLTGPDQKPVLARLVQEHDNLRAALAQSVQAGDVELALRTAGGLWRFWWLQGHIEEGRGWLRKVLALLDDGPWTADEGGMPEYLAFPASRALQGAGVLARCQCDYSGAKSLLERGLALARRSGETLRSAALLNSLGLVALDQGLYAEAEPYFMQSMDIERQLGDKQRLAISLNNLGGVSHYQGRYERATEFYLESLALRRELGDNWGIANSLYNLGESAYFQGKYAEAASLHRESLALRRELGDTRGLAPCMEGLAGALAALGECAVAARLLGASEVLREANAAPVSHADRAHHEQMVAVARAGLPEGAFAQAWSAGREMSLEQALGTGLAASP